MYLFGFHFAHLLQVAIIWLWPVIFPLFCGRSDFHLFKALDPIYTEKTHSSRTLVIPGDNPSRFLTVLRASWNLEKDLEGRTWRRHRIWIDVLNQDQIVKLFHELRQHRKTLGYTIENLQGISPSICMHRILTEEGHKPSIELQMRLYLNSKEVVWK